MRIGLYGIQGVYNFGCEAIVRGAYNLLKSLFPSSTIIYFSYSFKNDMVQLADLDLEIKEVSWSKSNFKRIINKGLKLINSQHQFLMIDYEKIIEDVDMIVSIGGDIYTIPEILRLQRKYPYYNQLVDFCDKAINKGKTVIAYGASVGPWGNYQKAVDYNVKALSKYKLILCREEETISYLNGLGMNNAIFFPDPAFQIKKGESGVKKYIGINLSPLSLKELYGSYDDMHVEKLANLMDRLYKETKINLMFIPHVLSGNASDNDLLFMQKIKARMSYKDNVVFANSEKGFLGLKKYISQCYVVAAARMHCAVNAIDENIPAIFLAYSQKGVGMCKYVYGDEKYLINLKDIEQKLLEKVQEVVNDSEVLSKWLEHRNEEISLYYEQNLESVKSILIK